jgi:hypothetical protein
MYATSQCMIVPFLYVTDIMRGYQLSKGIWQWLEVRDAAVPPPQAGYQRNANKGHPKFDLLPPNITDKIYNVHHADSSPKAVSRFLHGSGATLWDCSGCDEGSIEVWLEAKWR